MSEVIQDSARRNTLFLLLFLLVFAFAGWMTLDTYPGPSQDDAGFQRISFDYVKLGKGVDSFHPESSFMPLEYGRLFLFLSGNVGLLLGVTLGNVRMIPFLSLLASIPVLFFLLRRLGLGGIQSLLLTIAVASSHSFLLLREARPEAVGTLFILIAILLLVNKTSRTGIVALCVLCALLIHVHLPYSYFAFALCLVPFLSRDNPRDTIFMFSSIALSGIAWLILLYLEYGSFEFIRSLFGLNAAVSSSDSFDVKNLFGFSAGFFDRFLVFPIRIYEQVQYGKRNIIDVLFLLTGILASISAVVLRSETSTSWQKLNLFIVCVFVLFLLVGRINVAYLRMILPLCYLSVYRVFAQLTKHRDIIAKSFVLLAAAANILVTSKALWTSRTQMDSLPHIRQAIESHIPTGARVLGKESLWFALPSLNLVGVRDLAYRSAKNDFTDYFRRQDIQYVIDCNDLNVTDEVGSAREFLRERGRTIFYQKMHNDMLQGQESHTWGVSDTLSSLSIIAINNQTNTKGGL